MRNTLLFTFFSFSLITRTFGQAAPVDLRVTGNINIDASGTSYTGSYNTVPAAAGSINLMGDIQFTGSNSWIFHTPNDGRTALYLAPNSTWTRQTRFDGNGDVAFSQRVFIGDISSPGTLGTNNQPLAVGGKVGARAVYVVAPTAPWPDYVFAKAYRLPPLREVARFVAANHHLPEVPSAATVRAEGLDLGRMDALLLKKVEELTLYLLALKQENDALRDRVSKLEN